MGKLSFWITAAFTFSLFARPQEIYFDLSITGLQKTLGIAAVVACLFSLKGGVFDVLKQKITVFAALYFGAILISIPFGLWPGGSVEFLTDTLIKQVAILAVMILTLRQERQLKLLMKLIVWSSVIVAGHTIATYVAGMNLTEGYRASLTQGVFSDPNDLALHMVFSIPMAYFLMYRPARHKWIPLAVMAALIVAVMLTFSRGGMIGLGAVAVAIWYFDREHRRRNLILMAAALFLVVLSFPASIERLSTISDYENNPEASMMARWTILKGGLQIFSEHPLMGVGLRCFSVAEGEIHGGFGKWREAHNSFVQIAAETGILGLIGFAGCMYLIIKSWPVNYLEDRKKYDLLVGIRSSAIGFLACALFLSQVYSWYFFYLLAFTFSFSRLASPEPCRETSSMRSASA